MSTAGRSTDRTPRRNRSRHDGAAFRVLWSDELAVQFAMNAVSMSELQKRT
jgi:hypothetical protein